MGTCQTENLARFSKAADWGKMEAISPLIESWYRHRMGSSVIDHWTERERRHQ